MTITEIITLLGGGAALGKVLDYGLARFGKARDKTDAKAEAASAADITDRQVLSGELWGRLVVLEAREGACRERVLQLSTENTELKGEIKALHVALAELKAELAELTQTVRNSARPLPED